MRPYNEMLRQKALDKAQEKLRHVLLSDGRAVPQHSHRLVDNRELVYHILEHERLQAAHCLLFGHLASAVKQRDKKRNAANVSNRDAVLRRLRRQPARNRVRRLDEQKLTVAVSHRIRSGKDAFSNTTRTSSPVPGSIRLSAPASPAARAPWSMTASVDMVATKAWRRVPLVRHDDWHAFCSAQPFGAMWVAVEMGGEPLEEFDHPERAVYILGSEDSGLPKSVVRACHRHVTLPAAKYESFNVAVAGALVMYDRLAKERARRKEGGSPHKVEGSASHASER